MDRSANHFASLVFSRLYAREDIRSEQYITGIKEIIEVGGHPDLVAKLYRLRASNDNRPCALSELLVYLFSDPVSEEGSKYFQSPWSMSKIDLEWLANLKDYQGLAGQVYDLISFQAKTNARYSDFELYARCAHILGSLEGFSHAKDSLQSFDDHAFPFNVVPITIVHNKGISDYRVKKSSESLVENFGLSFVFGRDTMPEAAVVCDGGSHYVIAPAVKARYRSLHRRLQSNREKYRIEQIYFASWISSYAFSVSKGLAKDLILYSHDMHSLATGAYVRNNLHTASRNCIWLHDFHEWVEGLAQIEGHSELIDMFLTDEERLANEVDHSVTVSDGLSKNLCRKYGVQSTVVYNSSSARKQDDSASVVSLREKFNLSNDNIVIVYSGAIAEKRRVDMPLRALANIKNLHYIIVTRRSFSDDPILERIRCRAQQLGVLDRIHLHPYVPAEFTWKLIEGCDAVVSMPIKNANSEIALPNKLFDALKAGVPFLSVERKEVRDFLRRHKCGLVFRDDDPKDFEDKIRRLDSCTVKVEWDRFFEYSWDNCFKKVANRIAEMCPPAMCEGNDRSGPRFSDRPTSETAGESFQNSVEPACTS